MTDLARITQKEGKVEMTRDPYSPCPCGSGKKLKFCCSAIVTDIERIQKLRSSNQPKLALQSLSELRKSHPDNAWIITTEDWRTFL